MIESTIRMRFEDEYDYKMCLEFLSDPRFEFEELDCKEIEEEEEEK